MTKGRLAGKVALITGAGTGIGRSTALMMAAEGAAVALAGRRAEPLDAVVKEIEKAGARAEARTCDVSNTGQARALAKWAEDTFGRVDILVNNAGFASKVRTLRWVSEEEWRSVVDVNLTAVYALTQSVLPAMLARKHGTIITVTSLAALRPGLISGAPYGAAKAGARNLMQDVHTEFRNQGIRATTIIPAEVDTDILENRPMPPDAAARATMMQAEDVAEAILFCATLPARTVIEEIVMSPTLDRDRSSELRVAARFGEPGFTPPR